LAILDALRRRDPDGAEASMRLHIRRSLEQLQSEAEAEEAAAGEPRPGPTRPGGLRVRA